MHENSEKFLNLFEEFMQQFLGIDPSKYYFDNADFKLREFLSNSPGPHIRKYSYYLTELHKLYYLLKIHHDRGLELAIPSDLTIEFLTKFMETYGKRQNIKKMPYIKSTDPGNDHRAMYDLARSNGKETSNRNTNERDGVEYDNEAECSFPPTNEDSIKAYKCSDCGQPIRIQGRCLACSIERKRR